MKRIFVLAVCLWLAAAGVATAALFGPAQPSGKAGTFSIGPGVEGYNGELEDNTEFRQTLVYVQAGYALTDHAEVYLQGGGADLRVDGGLFNKDFGDDYAPFGSVGIKAVVVDKQPVGVGLFAQGSYFSSYEDSNATGKVEIDETFEGVGGMELHTVFEGATVYGGPFFFYRGGGDWTQEVAGVTVASDDFEEDSNFGAFLGIRWPIKDDYNIDLEGQYRSGFSGGIDLLINF
jgi:hypothetical protein